MLTTIEGLPEEECRLLPVSSLGTRETPLPYTSEQYVPRRSLRGRLFIKKALLVSDQGDPVAAELMLREAARHSIGRVDEVKISGVSRFLWDEPDEVAQKRPGFVVVQSWPSFDARGAEERGDRQIVGFQQQRNACNGESRLFVGNGC